MASASLGFAFVKTDGPEQHVQFQHVQNYVSMVCDNTLKLIIFIYKIFYLLFNNAINQFKIETLHFGESLI